MRDKKSYSNYTIYSLLDELDVIEYNEHPRKVGHWGEVTKKQQALYESLEVQVPVCIIQPENARCICSSLYLSLKNPNRFKLIFICN